MKLTQERLKEILHYDPDTGDFTRLVRTSSNANVGDIAGTDNSKGYLKIRIDGIAYYAHRLASFYMTGIWPKDEIDHRDGVRSNNKWVNLREATHAINQQNKRQAQRNNSTGFLGVYPCGKGFQAKIKLNKKQHGLGVYPTPQEGHVEYLKAKRELHPGCTI